jgi:hypothetical protein
MLKDLSKAIRGGHIAQPRRAGSGAAFECLAVHFDDPECGSVTEVPFEVIEQAPILISRHVNAVIDAATHSGQGAGELIAAKAEVGYQSDVLRAAVERVAPFAARVGASRGRVVFELPPVVVDIASLDLMGSRGRPPLESVGKQDGMARHRSGDHSGT